MPALPVRRPARKRPGRYHHGDLRRALLQGALRIIQRDGVGALTLRAVAADLGVSRTALYRHFADKAALLAAVGAEGFQTFRLALQGAWDQAGGGWRGFEAMGAAYVHFAVENPSYYRVMFGGWIAHASIDPALAAEGAAAFEALVNALVELQTAGLVRHEDPTQQATFIWATVHGVAMLVIDGQLDPHRIDPDDLTRYTVARVRDAIRA